MSKTGIDNEQEEEFLLKFSFFGHIELKIQLTMRFFFQVQARIIFYSLQSSSIV